MIIKKGDIQHRLNLFIQLEKYNETVGVNEKVCPYEVLVNISYLEPLLMKIDQDRLELIEELSDGFTYVYSSDGSVGKLKEGDLLPDEIESKLSPSSMPTFRSKYLDLLNEEIINNKKPSRQFIKCADLCCTGSSNINRSYLSEHRRFLAEFRARRIRDLFRNILLAAGK